MNISILKILFVFFFCSCIISCGVHAPVPEQDLYIENLPITENLQPYDGTHQIGRYFDYEANVVCWIITNSIDYTASISCLPMRDLAISFINRNGEQNESK